VCALHHASPLPSCASYLYSIAWAVRVARVVLVQHVGVALLLASLLLCSGRLVVEPSTDRGALLNIAQCFSSAYIRSREALSMLGCHSTAVTVVGNSARLALLLVGH
jgi:hypothetical protein